MRTYFVILLLSSVGSFLLTPLARRLAFRWGAVDLPGGRRIHTEPMPRLGGLAVLGGFCLPWVGFYLFDNRVSATFQNFEKLFLALMLGALGMALIGAWDDVKGLSAGRKLLLQTAIAVGLYFAGFQIRILSNPFGAPLSLGWLSLPVSVLWIVGITNAINLLDGIDGLAAGVGLCIALSLALMNMLGGNIFVVLVSLCLAGSCLGFLPYNYAPARIFLGDSGSLVLGLVLSCVGILSLFKAATATFVLAPLILFGLPLFDTVSVMIGRWLRGTSVFSADKSHVHHHLLRMGLTHPQASMLLYAVTLGLGGTAILISIQQSPVIALVGGGLVLVLALGLGVAWRLRQGNSDDKHLR
jgi:UDP-GlcNAc:undecaprenyl-phosphate GlcNAc-1-phosphate transferase